MSENDYIPRSSIGDLHPQHSVIKDCTLYVDAKELLQLVDGIPAANVETVRHWIPCRERLPEEPGRYLVCVKPGCSRYAAYVDILTWDGTGWTPGCFYTDRVTHWMELPEVPEAEKYPSPCFPQERPSGKKTGVVAAAPEASGNET